ncbi:hypothetical protein ABFA07_011977 [Porites harrisoni]
MGSKKAVTILALFILSSFFHPHECYIGILDAGTYRTVTGFADECVQLFKNRKLRKRFKKFVRFQDRVCLNLQKMYCSTAAQKPEWPWSNYQP